MAVPVHYLMVKNTASGMVARMQMALSAAGLYSFMSNQVDAYLRNQADRRFATEGDAAVGGTWHPLALATESWREWGGFPAQHPINQRTGELREFVTKTPGAVVAGAGTASITLPGDTPSDQWLLQKFQTAQAGRGSAPARPVLGLDVTDGVAIGIALIENMFGGTASVKR